MPGANYVVARVITILPEKKKRYSKIVIFLERGGCRTHDLPLMLHELNQYDIDSHTDTVQLQQASVLMCLQRRTGM